MKHIYYDFWFFLLYLKSDLDFLIFGVIAQIFKSIVELAIPIVIPSNEAKAEIEIHVVTAEAKKGHFSI